MDRPSPANMIPNQLESISTKVALLYHTLEDSYVMCLWPATTEIAMGILLQLSVF